MSNSPKTVYYAVAIGRIPGVYTSAIKCQEQVINFKNAKSKRFSTRKEAEDFIQKCNDELNPNSTLSSDQSLSLSTITESISTSYQSEKNHNNSNNDCTIISSSSTKTYFYAVKVGRNPGIYTNWQECQNEVYKFKNSKFARCKSKEEANQFIETGMKFSRDQESHSSSTKKSSKFYAVKTGFQPGIYNSFEEFQKQVIGFKNPIGQKFSSLKDAEDFMLGVTKSERIDIPTFESKPLHTSTSAQVLPIPQSSSSKSSSNSKHLSVNGILNEKSLSSLNFHYNIPAQQFSSFDDFRHSQDMQRSSSHSSINSIKSIEKKRKVSSEEDSQEEQESQESMNKKSRVDQNTDEDVGVGDDDVEMINELQNILSDRMQILEKAFNSIPSLKWIESDRLASLNHNQDDMILDEEGEEKENQSL